MRATQQWLTASGGPLAVVVVGLGVGGFTNRWVGLVLVVGGALWFLGSHFMPDRRMPDRRKEPLSARAQQLADDVLSFGERRALADPGFTHGYERMTIEREVHSRQTRSEWPKYVRRIRALVDSASEAGANVGELARPYNYESLAGANPIERVGAELSALAERLRRMGK